MADQENRDHANENDCQVVFHTASHCGWTSTSFGSLGLLALILALLLSRISILPKSLTTKLENKSH